MMKTKWLSLFLVLSIFSFGQDFNGYYDGVDTSLSGNALKEELHTLITSTHTRQLSYKQVWGVLKESDVDPDNSQNVLLMYGSTNSGTHERSRSKNKNGGDAGDWNREHVYAKSLGTPDLGTSGPGADAHHLRPADVQLNGNRGNHPFADGMGVKAGKSNGGWYPGDEWKGDVARMVMYMYVRYGNRCRLTNVALGPRTYNQDIPDVLIKWNIEDPVSDFERQRNNVVQEEQGNRNPFIDHPEWVSSIWGGPNVDPVDPSDDVIFSEDFNECSTVKFKTVSELSDQNWECISKYGHNNSGAYQMNAYSGGASIVSKDWLITSTAIDLDNYKDKKLSVYAKSKYGNTPLKILYSNDYNGNGMPQNFTWKEVPNATLPTPAGSEVETNVSADINALTGKVYFAFLYENPAGVDASRWTVDNFVVKGTSTLSTDEAEAVDFQVYPNPVTNREVFVKGQNLDKIKSVTIYNMEGKVVKTIVNPFIHGNRLDISSLAKGVYFLQTPNRSVKLIVQ